MRQLIGVPIPLQRCAIYAIWLRVLLGHQGYLLSRACFAGVGLFVYILFVLPKNPNCT